MELNLLKTIHSYLNAKIPFKFILFTTLYLYKNNLKYKTKPLLKKIKNINNAKARQLSKKAIKSNNKVRTFISALQKRTIHSLENINNINKYCFKPKLYQKL